MVTDISSGAGSLSSILNASSFCVSSYSVSTSKGASTFTKLRNKSSSLILTFAVLGATTVPEEIAVISAIISSSSSTLESFTVLIVIVPSESPAFILMILGVALEVLFVMV